ncbi:alpha/beta hydrolase [Actinotalea sp. M2MS4P-6]|uniref:alpha/beta fold hydrolase n=1 Tax=Actinotalea sp. M2MS4P-6 TaxID=2983762 RepID=UPI0021E3C207|nr:alpha/beta hydrolase [Actinotalea sp. M2MS4P-6]MCV2393261.1 alpha/beta hydrolase [Actinotalea sp. M2MS4P-6]
MPERGDRPRVGDLFVDVAGDPGQPAIVFVHGGGPSGRMWRAHLDALGDRYHCLAPDLPGFGRSNHLAPVSLDQAAGLVAELIETRVPGGRASVVGLSYGGSVVLSLMGGRADVLDRVVVDGAGVLTWWGDRLVIAGVAAVSPIIRTRAVHAVLGRVGMSGLADELRTASPAAFRRAFAEGWVAPLSRALLAAPCPTLLVGGENEQTVRASNAALAALLPSAEARFAPAHGHGWFAWELDLHIRMVEAWVAGGELPSELGVEPPSQAAVERVLARLSPRG